MSDDADKMKNFDKPFSEGSDYYKRVASGAIPCRTIEEMSPYPFDGNRDTPDNDHHLAWTEGYITQKYIEESQTGYGIMDAEKKRYFDEGLRAFQLYQETGVAQEAPYNWLQDPRHEHWIAGYLDNIFDRPNARGITSFCA